MADPLPDAACTAHCNLSVVLPVSRANPSVLNVPISESLQQPLQRWPLQKVAATNIGLTGEPGEAIPFPHPLEHGHRQE
jgi:hypothetical protein